MKNLEMQLIPPERMNSLGHRCGLSELKKTYPQQDHIDIKTDMEAQNLKIHRPSKCYLDT